MTTYKLVPVEPTEEMLTALNRHAVCAGHIEAGYAAMLAVAPSPWRPIEEAPSGNAEFLACDADSENKYRFIASIDPWIFSTKNMVIDNYGEPRKATHYLPIPEPPK